MGIVYKETKGFNQSVVADIHSQLQKYYAIGDMIVAGVDSTNGECYAAVIAEQGTIYDRIALGLACAGNGFSLANLFMAKSGYNKLMDSVQVKKLVRTRLWNGACSWGGRS